MEKTIIEPIALEQIRLDDFLLGITSDNTHAEKFVHKVSKSKQVRESFKA